MHGAVRMHFAFGRVRRKTAPTQPGGNRTYLSFEGAACMMGTT